MPMLFEFDAKHVHVPDGQIAVDVGAMYDDIKAAQATEVGILFPQIARGAGRFDLGGGRSSGLIVELLDGWQLHFPDGAGQVTVDGGTLIGGIAGQPIAFAVDTQPILNRPADAFAVSTSGGSAPSAAENAAAVWANVTGAAVAARVGEAWGRLGLDPARPLTQGETEISFGAIVLAVVDAPGLTTVTRQ